MRHTPVLCVTLVAVAGCYTYRPATVETVAVGTEIRSLLATEARIALEERFRRRFDQVDGRLVERRADSVLVEVRSVSAVDGRGLYQRVELAQADMLRVDVKRVDKVRTIALVAGIVTVATLVAMNTFWSTGADDGGGGPPEAPPVGGARTRLHD